MSLFDKIYYFWEDTKHEQSVLFYMIATFFVMVAAVMVVGLFALPIILACALGWYWLFLWFITIPMIMGVISQLIDIVE